MSSTGRPTFIGANGNNNGQVQGKPMMIIDARPVLNATANQAGFYLLSTTNYLSIVCVLRYCVFSG